ncbi:MAG TPA: ABC transporter ATP-binding protein, partial [Humisphaera sp.]
MEPNGTGHRPTDGDRRNDGRAAGNEQQAAGTADAAHALATTIATATGSPPAAKPRKRSNRDFWRAMRFVWPYRRTILTSVVCAFFVGLAVSGGLTTLTPIMRVLLNNQTIQHWADATIVEHRLGVRLLEESPEVQVVKVNEAGEASGIRAGDRIVVDAVTHDGVATPGPGGGKPPAQTLDALAGDGRAGEANLTLRRGDQAVPARVTLAALPTHLGVLRTASRWVSADPVWAIAQIFVLLGIVATTGNVLKFFQEYLSDKVAVTAVNDVRRKVYDHILHVPMSHFGRHGTTDVTSRLVQDSMALEVGFKTVLGQSIQQPIVAGMAFGVALWTSWQLTLVIVLFAPLMGAVIQKFGKKMRRAARGAMQKNASMLGQIEGTLAGVRVVKAAGAERWERRRYRGIMRGLVHEQLRMSRLEAAGSPIMETITLVCVGIIVLIATYMVTRSHSLSVTQFFLVMACLATIGDSLRRLNKVNGVLQRANAGAQRMFEVLALPVERRRELSGDRASDNGQTTRDQGPGAARRLVRLKPIAREVRFEHVTFTYPGANAPALDDVSLVVPKGRCVAVVGRNGSGKTTLLTLLPRFYAPDSGRVTIDGVDVADATLRSLRGQIAVVTQDSVIFPGTIAENIAYGHPLAGQLRHGKDTPAVRQLRLDIEQAAKRAFAHDFILEKPAGYDTVLDGLGGQLSGGQKQRLCIARAILRKAPILILDEATSQVDAENEHLIQQAIDRLLHEGHDPATGAPTSA